MRGLLLKTWYEVRVTTLMFGVALLGIDALLTYVIPQFQQGILEVIERMPFVKPILSAMLGMELGNEITARTWQAFVWVHPTVLALIWAHAIVFCARLPAGEIDRGTIDMFLGMPVSRRKVYYAEVAAWLAAGLFVIAMGAVGHRLTSAAMPDNARPTLPQVMQVMTSLYCVYLAVGGIAFLISSLSDRRGRAMAVAFAFVLASFLLNFLAQVWPPAQRFAPLGILQYYRPVEILQNGFPTANVAILFSVAALTIVVGGEIMARRSICTV